jgi:hypothetical protein
VICLPFIAEGVWVFLDLRERVVTAWVSEIDPTSDILILELLLTLLICIIGK